MAASPLNSRLPSPPPIAEDHIGPKSPMTMGFQPPSAHKDGPALPTRRIRPGTKAADMAEGPPMVSLNEINSAFQHAEYLKAKYHHLTSLARSDSIVPLDRKSARDLVEPPFGVNRHVWLYELCRFLCQQTNLLITALLAETPPCSGKTCNEMRASEWQYLCAVHNPPRACTAIDYCCHTLDWAVNTLTSPANFPSRMDIDSDACLSTIFRRVYRVFGHSWFQHNAAFWKIESATGVYTLFYTTCMVYKVVPDHHYIIPHDFLNYHPNAPKQPQHAAPALPKRKLASIDMSVSVPSASMRIAPAPRSATYIDSGDNETVISSHTERLNPLSIFPVINTAIQDGFNSFGNLDDTGELPTPEAAHWAEAEGADNPDTRRFRFGSSDISIIADDANAADKHDVDAGDNETPTDSDSRESFPSFNMPLSDISGTTSDSIGRVDQLEVGGENYNGEDIGYREVMSQRVDPDIGYGEQLIDDDDSEPLIQESHRVDVIVSADGAVNQASRHLYPLGPDNIKPQPQINRNPVLGFPLPPIQQEWAEPDQPFATESDSPVSSFPLIVDHDLDDATPISGAAFPTPPESLTPAESLPQHITQDIDQVISEPMDEVSLTTDVDSLMPTERVHEKTLPESESLPEYGELNYPSSTLLEGGGNGSEDVSSNSAPPLPFSEEISPNEESGREAVADDHGLDNERKLAAVPEPDQQTDIDPDVDVPATSKIETDLHENMKVRSIDPSTPESMPVSSIITPPTVAIITSDHDTTTLASTKAANPDHVTDSKNTNTTVTDDLLNATKLPLTFGHSPHSPHADPNTPVTPASLSPNTLNEEQKGPTGAGEKEKETKSSRRGKKKRRPKVEQAGFLPLTNSSV